MLLHALTVYVPSQPERDADLGEYGHLGLATRAAFGAAAMCAGDPDHAANDERTTAIDTIANVLHWLHDELDADIDAEAVLAGAMCHFAAELAEQ